MIQSLTLQELIGLDVSKPIDNYCFSTGVDGIDTHFDDLIPGELIMIAGRPAMGKTRILQFLALNASLKNKVHYVAYDSTYLLAKTTREFVESKAEQFDKQSFNITFHPATIGLEVLLVLWKEEVDNGTKIFFLDDANRFLDMELKNHFEVHYHFAKRLKEFATVNNCVVVFTNGVNRSVEYRGGDRRPELQDIRHIDAFDCTSKIVTLYRPSIYGLEVDEMGEDIANWIFLRQLKNSKGPLISTSCHVNKAYNDFCDHLMIDNYTIDVERIKELKNW